MTYDDLSTSVAVEHYRFWQRLGMTHHEMMTACQQRYEAGMTGDDVIVELVVAWNGLERA